MGAPKRAVAGMLPFSGFLLKNQPVPAPQTQAGGVTRPPHSDPTQSQTHNTDEIRSKNSHRQSQVISQMKRPKHEVKKNPEKQRGNLLLENSEQSSGEWSGSDGELIIDMPSSSHHKKDVGKRRREAGATKRSLHLEEEGCGDGEGEGT